MLAIGGFIAAGLNGVVGTGSLVSFPVLLAAGYSPVVANVTNTIVLCPGYLGNCIGFRHAIDKADRASYLTYATSGIGGLVGALALVSLPEGVFTHVVPFLIVSGAVLMYFQPKLNARLNIGSGDPLKRSHLASLGLATFGTGVYAGYFGAGASVLFMAIAGIFLTGNLHRMAAFRSLLTLLSNLVAAVVFVLVSHIAWVAVAVMAPATVLGGWVGSRVALKVPIGLLRWLVVAFSFAVAVALFLGI